MTIHWCPCACNEFAPSVCVCVCGLNDCKSQAFRSAQMKNLLSLSVPVPCPQFYGVCVIRGGELNSGIPEQDCKLITIECWSVSEKAAKSARKATTENSQSRIALHFTCRCNHLIIS